MNKLFASVLLCAALLGSGILRADNIVISNRKSSILITAPKGESPRIQYFGPRLANPGDVFDSGSAFNVPVYPQFGVQCSRETAIQATHNDGNMSLELVVESVTRENRDGGQVTAIATRDKFYPFYVTIYYKTYPDCEVIETWTEIRHLEKKPVTLYRFASAFLRRQLALALPRPLGRRGIPLRGSADRRHEGHQRQGRRTQYAEQLPVVHAHARRAPR